MQEKSSTHSSTWSPSRPATPTAPARTPRKQPPSRRRPLLILGALISLGLGVLCLTQHQPWAALVCFVASAGAALAIFPNVLQRLKRPAKSNARPRTTPDQARQGAAPDHDDLLHLHNVPGPSGNIDYVVFRPNGAVAVLHMLDQQGRVSDARDSLRINGEALDKDYLGIVHRNAIWIRDQLRDRYDIQAFVTAVLVFTNATVTVRRPIRGVEIASQRFLLTLLRRQPANLKTASAIKARLKDIESGSKSWNRD